MTYKPGLDSIRCFAVLFVIVHHWFPGFFPEMAWGTLGVDIFFFLSGFLITNGLLADMRQPAGQLLKKFYLKRTLRIFPLYYASVLLLILAGIIGSEWPWFVTYTVNHYLYEHGWKAYSSHFWSLAVEEQFYLVWPVLLLVFRKNLVLFMLLTIASSYLLRVALSDNEKGVILTVTNMYKFALGGIFSYYSAGIKRMNVLPGVIVSMAFPVLYIIFSELRPLLVPVLSFGLFHIALKGWFNFRPIAYLGRISYGIYIFHNFLPWFVAKVVDHHSDYFYPVCFVALVIVSALSYELFERRVMRLRHRFEMKKVAA